MLTHVMSVGLSVSACLSDWLPSRLYTGVSVCQGCSAVRNLLSGNMTGGKISSTGNPRLSCQASFTNKELTTR
jgi:hypothetical protein